MPILALASRGNLSANSVRGEEVAVEPGTCGGRQFYLDRRAMTMRATIMATGNTTSDNGQCGMTSLPIAALAPASDR
jgi:hypothetical protein